MLRARIMGLATILGCLLAVPAGAETTNLFAAPAAKTASSDPTMLTVSFTIVHVFFDNYPGFAVGITKPFTDKITLVGEFRYNRPHSEDPFASSLLVIVAGGRYLIPMKSSAVAPYVQLSVGVSHVSDPDNFYGTALMYAPAIGATFKVNDKIRAHVQSEWGSHKHRWSWAAGVDIPIMTTK